MVEGLSKRITGDWVEIGQAAVSLSGLAGYFQITPAALTAVAGRLAAAALHGVIEYKQSVLHPLFDLLEDMKFKSIGSEALSRQQDEAGRLVFVTLVERLVATGGVRSTATAAEPAAGSSGAGVAGDDLKLILADVLGRVREEPGLKNNMAVKLILTQLAIYQREREVMEKLKPNITEKEKAAAFRRNFNNTFQKISDNIRKYYREFLDEERRRTHLEHRLSLADYNLRGLVALLTRQAREFARVRSTLAFAIEGGYKVREICVHFLNEKTGLFGLLDDESAAYRGLAEDGNGKKDDGHELSRVFTSEIAAVIGRLAVRETEPSAAGDE